MTQKNQESSVTAEMLLPWASIVEQDAAPAQRKEAIRRIFRLQRQDQGRSLEARMAFIACGQLAIMTLLVDLLEQNEEKTKLRDAA